MTIRRIHFAGLGAGVAGAALSAAATAMPSRVWSHADRVELRCSVAEGVRASAGDDFCAAVLAYAARNAPIPVETDPGAGGSGTVIVEVSAAAAPSGATITVRASPRVAIHENDVARMTRPLAAGAPALPVATALLDAMLPWRAS